jgi:hypothetical protein
MSRSVRDDIESLREAQARAQQDRAELPPVPVCEAERRNRQALYLLENEWGCGRINVGELQRVLRGDEPDTCKETR